ncbi:hypothetical protein GL213_10935 [Halogeometricum borinquense]|uniref:Uncharacterized protein n=1 Tax=Halogeometricum borinquense (strain ATCC 700274 / DSM 11551 / JCM 10706 / KCTC 4070 / PR3) TaxID=469382 RepID=E4NQ21_HALBP|nr:hypothetical protein [Halogeometricum borinquense]ADQ67766.1 hypothetical protein Hbor_22030 [Halogeometricum borinquense DSM 11551]ELY23552.1 hypothetical protein C499_17414 [Halogeometricum borinquense DSM 11551]QIQ76991.1 hypothetical protein GL213_10935 [Halogeometricum borinquense]
MEHLDGEELDGPDEPESTVAAHRSSPDRTVFTERGNTDAWISIETDATVELEP